MVQWYEIKIDYDCHLGGKSVKKARKYLILGAVSLVLVGVLANPGCTTTRRTGWFEDEGQYYYYNDKGDKVTGWLIRDDGSYYLTETGRVTGWQEIDGKRHYFDSDGIMVLGWQEIDGSTYFFGEEGTPLTGQTAIGGRTYCFDENGARLTGWQEFDGQTVYLAEDGSFHEGWLEFNGHTYYMEAGVPCTGILPLDGRNYFFDSRGWQILMVNPWNTAPEGHEVELAPISDEFDMEVEAAAAFDVMNQDMIAIGKGPKVNSTYRSAEKQKELFDQRVNAYITQEGLSEEKAREIVSRSVAAPGTSEHQLGLAVDISDATYVRMDASQMETPTQLWMIDNSWRYGFILRYPNNKSKITGIEYEPWHYRYVGKELSAELYELDMTMEEYLDWLTEDKTLTASNPANGNLMP